MLRTFLGFKLKKLRTSEGFIEFWCSYKKNTCIWSGDPNIWSAKRYIYGDISGLYFTIFYNMILFFYLVLKTVKYLKRVILSVFNKETNKKVVLSCGSGCRVWKIPGNTFDTFLYSNFRWLMTLCNSILRHYYTWNFIVF